MLVPLMPSITPGDEWNRLSNTWILAYSTNWPLPKSPVHVALFKLSKVHAFTDLAAELVVVTALSD